MAASPATLAPSGIRRAEREGGAPARGGDLELIGELAGSGYREAPRLVRRADGQLIKLTPLLYELLDAIDGRRNHAELADELSGRVGKLVAAEDVSFLIERKLRPLGLLEGDGVEPDLQKANPLLALHPRFVITKPGLTRALTRPFVWLFKAPVMIFFSLAFAAVCGWLLFDKGLSSALHQAMYEPGLILAVWGLIVLSAAFHEIGHAAACRYGGATPGVMGGGIYLIWPAFYTEVTDAYRLGRRARLRVDLGGLYFSALFAVLTTVVWWFTRTDALLLVIAFQLLQMVRQLVPFVRADGYHILADLTGVPDLFSRIKPTLLGLLPTRWKRPENKVLKPWARAVVTAWVLFTVPVLLAGLAFIVLAFPRIVATAWDSINMRSDLIATHWSDGDVAGVAMDAISIGLVALPAFGIAYLILRLARHTSRRVWRATAERPRQRALAAVGAAGVIAALAWAWWPDDDYRPIEPTEGGPVPTVVSAPPPVPVQYVQLQSVYPAYAIAPAQAPMPVVLPGVGYLPAVTAPAPAQTTPEQSPAGSQITGAGEDPIQPTAGAAPASAGAPIPAANEGVQPAAASTAPAPPAPAPASESAPAEAWPFPWDPPAAPEPGDNLVMAVNTTDGSSLWELASALVIEDSGRPVLQENQAHAYASCSDCVTGAVAFMVVLIVGQVDEIAPLNAAVAANFECVSCVTYAFAYQIVASLLGDPDAELLADLEESFGRLEALEGQLGSLGGAEIYLLLESIEHDILAALDGHTAIDLTPDGEGSGAPDPPAAVTGPGETPTAPAAEQPQTPAEAPAAGDTAVAEEPASAAPEDAVTDAPVSEQPAAEATTDGASGGEPAADTDPCAEATAPEPADTSTSECPTEPATDAGATTTETTTPEPTTTGTTTTEATTTEATTETAAP